MRRSSTLLKVVSILMIIFGGIGLLLGLLGLVGAGMLTQLDIDADLAQLAMVASVVLLIGSAIQLVAGIVGVKNHNKPENSKVCMIFACIVILLQLFGNIFDIATGGFTGTTIFNVLIGLVIPVLYLIGTLQLKKLAEGVQEQNYAEPMQ